MYILAGQPLLQWQGQEKRTLQNIFLTYRYWRQKNLISQITAKFYDARPNGSHSSDYIYIYIYIFQGYPVESGHNQYTVCCMKEL